MIQQLHLENIIQSKKWEHWGLTSLTRPRSFDSYLKWIDDSFHGGMDYLVNHIPQKEYPQLLQKDAQSAIVLAKAYAPEHPYTDVEMPLKHLQIAAYAQGGDYHYYFMAELNELCDALKMHYPEESFVAFTDSAPVLERDLAYRAGLGWVGKNTCLIDRKRGSFFLIGEIYTSLKLDLIDNSPKDFCGTCTRCIDACPTGALVEPRKLDARKCISYLTIESSESHSEELRTQIGELLFGCDICQQVCPWNKKHLSTKSIDSNSAESREAIVHELRWILQSSNKALQKTLRSTPLSRSAGNKLKRNALIVIANGGYSELIDEVQIYLNHPKLSELAQWCLNTLNGRSLRKNI